MREKGGGSAEAPLRAIESLQAAGRPRHEHVASNRSTHAHKNEGRDGVEERSGGSLPLPRSAEVGSSDLGPIIARTAQPFAKFGSPRFVLPRPNHHPSRSNPSHH